MISGEDVIEMSGVETLHPGGLDISRRIGEVVELGPAVHVLDVSSGKGVFACAYAEEFGCRVTGIDISAAFTAAASARAAGRGLSERVAFRVGDSRSLPFADGSFDVVVNECAVGLTAIGDPARVLGEMSRVARPGGWVVIHESTWCRSLPVEERRRSSGLLGTEPFTAEEWTAMLRNAGCEPEVVEDWSGVENYWKMRPGHRWSRRHPSDFLTPGEKLALFPRIFARHGVGALADLLRFRSTADRYLRDGVLGYVLIAARRVA